MQAFWIFIVIAWIIIPIIAKKKQQQAKEQAARERALKERAAQPVAQQRQASVRTAPITTSMRTNMQSSFEGTSSSEGFGSSEEGTPTHQIETTLQSKTSTLREIRVEPEHVVTASNESGHVHQETSMTGNNAACPPDAKPVSTVPSVPATESAFVWDSSQVRNGLILAEILGPCLALRNE
ncbi:MAG TPA: hypothetical protein VN453_03500 [Feifaniaceae bacterium]|nr:hypothetical protein [Feifaniaceae bacterium]